MRQKILLFTLLFLPSLAAAQTFSLQNVIKNFISFTNKTLIPFAIGLAFLFFVINVVRFFVVHGSDEDGRENAKNLALYSVLAFVILITFWGLVNLFSNSVGLEGQGGITPDYIEKQGGSLKPAPPINPSGNSNSPLCASGALFDENGDRCPEQPLPSTPPPPIAPVPIPPMTGPGNPSANPPTSLVDCLLPNGNIIEVSLDDCRARGGLIYN